MVCNMTQNDGKTRTAGADSRKNLDSRRFTQICGMLGSDQPGERANAALFATKMLRDAGMTWAALLGQLVDGDAPQAASEPVKVKTRSNGAWTAHDLIREVAGFVRVQENRLSAWDEKFLASLVIEATIRNHATVLSEKQWAHLERIGEKVGVAV